MGESAYVGFWAPVSLFWVRQIAGVGAPKAWGSVDLPEPSPLTFSLSAPCVPGLGRTRIVIRLGGLPILLRMRFCKLRLLPRPLSIQL